MTRLAPAGSTFTLALAGIVVRAVSRTMTALKNRRQVTALAQLDDRALKDIGLLRTDVQAALATPLYRDPSCHLMAVAGGSRGSSKPAETVRAPGLYRLRRDDAPVIASRLTPVAH
jgi:uncharacterized protein YjiS (DUF1127 family)